MKKTVLLAIALFCSASASAASHIEAAKTLIDAINHERVHEAADLLADDIVFEDPTWGARARGKSNVLKVYGGLMAGARDVSAMVLNAYESNDVVVLHYALSARMDLVENARPDQRAMIMCTMLRVLRFKDDKIIQHTDLMDAGKFMRQMQAAAESRGLKLK